MENGNLRLQNPAARNLTTMPPKKPAESSKSEMGKMISQFGAQSGADLF